MKKNHNEIIVGDEQKEFKTSNYNTNNNIKENKINKDNNNYTNLN